MPLTVRVDVPPRDREVLASWVRSPSIPAGLAQRARIVLLAGDGIGTNEIARRTGVSKPTVILWKKRWAAEGTGGLEDRPRPGKPRVIDDVAIVLATLEPPPERLGVTHWSSRRLAAELGVSNVNVAEWGLQPWRAESFKFSTDPPRSPADPQVLSIARRSVPLSRSARAAVFAWCDLRGDHAPGDRLAAWQLPGPWRGRDDDAEPAAADIPAVDAYVDTGELIRHSYHRSS